MHEGNKKTEEVTTDSRNAHWLQFSKIILLPNKQQWSHVVSESQQTAARTNSPLFLHETGVGQPPKAEQANAFFWKLSFWQF